MAGKYTSHHPALPDKPGTNWVEKVGGLPGPIEAVARALKAKGYTTSHAIAVGVNHVKKVCATGRAFGGRTPVSAEARAKACAAAARWEAMKAAARADNSIPVGERRALELAFKRVEGEALRIDMAAGLVPVRVKVTNANGTTFYRTQMVRPGQAKQMRAESGKSAPKVSARGLKVTREQSVCAGRTGQDPQSGSPGGVAGGGAGAGRPQAWRQAWA